VRFCGMHRSRMTSPGCRGFFIGMAGAWWRSVRSRSTASLSSKRKTTRDQGLDSTRAVEDTFQPLTVEHPLGPRFELGFAVSLQTLIDPRRQRAEAAGQQEAQQLGLAAVRALLNALLSTLLFSIPQV